MQVPGEQAADRGHLLRLRFASMGAFRGVDADKVMELVPVPSGFLEQVPAGQGPQELPCLRDRRIEQGRGRRGADVLARMQAQKPESPGWRGSQRPVGPGEDSADLGSLLIGGQDIQAVVFGGQLIGQVGRTEMGMGRGAVCGDPQGQRQPAAQLGQPARGGRVSGSPFVPGDPGDQGDSLAGREHVQGQPLRAVDGGQAAEPVAAGDDGEAADRPGEQWPDLPGACGIVQHDEDPPAAELAPVHRRQLIGIGRQLRRIGAQRTSEPG